MIKANCCMCQRELEQQGGILWSPPDDNDLCLKKHLCVFCAKVIDDFVEKNRRNPEKDLIP